MIMLGEHFALLQPAWLIAALGFAAMAWRRRATLASDDWHKIISPEVLAWLRDERGHSHRRDRRWWLLSLIAIALSQPAIVQDDARTWQHASTTLLLVDLSRSMQTADPGPSRLALARALAHRIVEALPPGSSGMIGFAGDAFVLAPPSFDTARLHNLIDALDTDLIPLAGSELPRALSLATRIMAESPVQRAHLFVLTDANALDGAAAQALRSTPGPNLVIDVLTIGTPSKLVDDIGTNSPHLNLHTLGSGTDINATLRLMDTRIKGAQAIAMQSLQWHPLTHWLALLILLLWWVSSRPTLPPQTAIVLLTLLPLLAQAGESTPNRLAWRYYQAGDYARAAALFEDPAWKGLAQYRATQAQRAAETLVQTSDAISRYNLGLAYLSIGYPALALQAFQQALILDPDLVDAQHNAEIVLQLLALDDEHDNAAARPSGQEAIAQLPEDETPSTPDQNDASPSDSSVREPSETDAQATADDAGAEGGAGEQSNAATAPGVDPEEADESASNSATHILNPGGEQTDSRSGQTGTQTASSNDRPQDEPGVKPKSADPSTHESMNNTQPGTQPQSDQYTAEWFNRLETDVSDFTRLHIELEIAHRRARGQLPEIDPDAL